MLPTAHLDGSSRIVGWRRRDSGAEGVATLSVLPNAPYRLVVYRVDGETPAGQASRRVWVASRDSRLQEVQPGIPVVIRGSGATGTTDQQVTLRMRVGLGEATNPASSEVPLRYEIQVEPTL